MWRRLYDAVFNRPFYDGKVRRRRYPGEKRGYSLPLVATQLVGSGLVIGLVAAIIAPFRRSEPKKKIGHA